MPGQVKARPASPRADVQEACPRLQAKLANERVRLGNSCIAAGAHVGADHLSLHGERRVRDREAIAVLESADDLLVGCHRKLSAG